MTWKLIRYAPRDGTVVMLAHVDFGYIEFHGRWGVHRQTGQERWVDGHGNALFNATHWDCQPELPKREDFPAVWQQEDDGA